MLAQCLCRWFLKQWGIGRTDHGPSKKNDEWPGQADRGVGGNQAPCVESVSSSDEGQYCLNVERIAFPNTSSSEWSFLDMLVFINSSLFIGCNEWGMPC